MHAFLFFDVCVCSAAGEGIWFEYVLAGAVITTLVTHFLHLTSPHSMCHVRSASLCCVRKYKVLKLAFLDTPAWRGVVVVAVAKVGNGYIIIFFPLFRLSHVARSAALYVVEALADRVSLLCRALCLLGFV